MSYSNYNGEKFLDKIYPKLHTSDEVIHTLDKSKTNAENIRTYLERIEHVHDKVSKNNKLERLLKYYYDKYVIESEDISDSKLYDGLTKEDVIKNQKDTLKKWISYLSSEGANYPLWAKYWVFQGMLKIGSYNELYNPNEPKTGKAFTSRSKHTVTPFIECNPELVAKAIDLITKYNNGKELNDEEVDKVISSGSFSKIYGILYYKNKQQNKSKIASDEGIWIKYNQGSEEEAIKLSNSLQGYDTGWCTANESTAISQVCGSKPGDGGDFYVYYSKDENGDCKIPRIAIRMNGKNNIGEIRGILDSQNLEDSMIPVLRNKLDEIDNLNDNDKDYYIQIINDLILLTNVYKKYKLKEPITEEEMINFYKVDIYGFGWDSDERALILWDEPLFKLGDEKTRANKELIKLALKKASVLQYVDENIDGYKEILEYAVRKYWNSLKYINDKYKDDELIKLAISCFGSALEFVPKEKITPEIADQAVKDSPRAIEFVPDYFDNYDELANYSYKKNNYNIKYISSNRKIYLDFLEDYSFCKDKASYEVLGSIPREFIDNNYDFYVSIVYRIIGNCRKGIEFIPTDIEDYFEIATYAIKRNYEEIANIPININGYDKLANYAVYLDDKALALIPKEKYNKELMKNLVSGNPHGLEKIPNEFVDIEIVRLAVDNGYVLCDKASKYVDYDIAFIALENDARYNLQFIPKELFDYKLSYLAVKNKVSLKDIPKKFVDKKLALIALNNDGLDIKYVSKKLIDSDVAYAAVTNNVKAFEYIPQNVITKEIADVVAHKNGLYLVNIPSDLVNYNMLVDGIYEDENYVMKDKKIVYECNGQELGIRDYMKYKKELYKQYFDNTLVEKAYQEANDKLDEYLRIIKEEEEMYEAIMMSG